jgi:hypothetical protein
MHKRHGRTPGPPEQDFRKVVAGFREKNPAKPTESKPTFVGAPTKVGLGVVTREIAQTPSFAT